PRANPHLPEERMAKKKQAIETVYKVVEVIGTSPNSWEDAARNAVETASQTLRDLRIAEVVKQDMKVEDGNVVAFRTRVLLSFKCECLSGSRQAGSRLKRARCDREAAAVPAAGYVRLASYSCARLPARWLRSAYWAWTPVLGPRLYRRNTRRFIATLIRGSPLSISRCPAHPQASCQFVRRRSQAQTAIAARFSSKAAPATPSCASWMRSKTWVPRPLCCKSAIRCSRPPSAIRSRFSTTT